MNERELMPGMTLENIARACQGRYIGDKKLLSRLISGAVTDSRQVTEGYLFIPIKGERVLALQKIMFDNPTLTAVPADKDIPDILESTMAVTVS